MLWRSGPLAEGEIKGTEAVCAGNPLSRILQKQGEDKMWTLLLTVLEASGIFNPRAPTDTFTKALGSIESEKLALQKKGLISHHIYFIRLQTTSSFNLGIVSRKRNKVNLIHSLLYFLSSMEKFHYFFILNLIHALRPKPDNYHRLYFVSIHDQSIKHRMTQFSKTKTYKILISLHVIIKILKA